MSKIIKASDLVFGDIDARHEILARDETKRNLFLDSFVLPRSLLEADLISGEKFLIHGPKGSGKTAFLRHPHHTLDKNDHSYSRFIVFRDDVTPQDRQKITELSQFRVYENHDDEQNGDELADCLSAWQLFIHREIASVIQRSNDLCAKTNDVKNYIKLMNSVFAQYKTSGFKKILQSVTKGRIKLQAFNQGIEAEAEFIDKHGNIDVSEFVRYCNEVIASLDFNSLLKNPRINIFFDELNISFVSGVEFRRNAVLIRDLVAACGVINARCSENGIPIYVYTAIRSEVADSVEGSVRELKKWIDDKSVNMDWIVPHADYQNQPLIDLLKKRIAANEKRILALNSLPPYVTLEKYFEMKIGNFTLFEYLTFETWGRPRDLVRMLSAASKVLQGDEKFGESSFFRSRGNYSKSCWLEKQDELNAKYSQTMIATITRLLSGFSATFSRGEFESRVSFQSNNDSRSKQFFDGRNLDAFLEDLFKVGVIGNIIKLRNGRNRPSYLYMGHANFDSHDIMCVHRSLWSELRITAPAKSAQHGKSRSRQTSRH